MQRLDAAPADVWIVENDTWLTCGDATALAERAGPRVRRELDRTLRAAGGELPLGSSIVSGPGRLPPAHLVHMTVSDWAAGRRLEDAALRAALVRALDQAAELEARVVALEATSACWASIDPGQRLELVANTVAAHGAAPTPIELVLVAIPEAPETTRSVSLPPLGLGEGTTAETREAIERALADPDRVRATELLLGVARERLETLPEGVAKELGAGIDVLGGAPPADAPLGRARWRDAIELVRRAWVSEPEAQDTRLEDSLDASPARRLGRLLSGELEPAALAHLVRECLGHGDAADAGVLTQALTAAPDLVGLLVQHLSFATLARLATTRAGTSGDDLRAENAARDLLLYCGFVVPEIPRGVASRARALRQLRADASAADSMSTIAGAATQGAAVGERILKDVIGFHSRRAFLVPPDELARREGWLAETFTLERCAFGSLLHVARQLGRRLSSSSELGARRHRDTFGDRALLPSSGERLAQLRNAFAHDRAEVSLVEARRRATELFDLLDALVAHLQEPPSLLPPVVVVVNVRVDKWGRRSATLLHESESTEHAVVEQDLRVGRSYFLWREPHREPFPVLLPVRPE